MKMLPVLTIATSLSLVLPGVVEAGTILLLPIPIGSHFMNFERIASSLMTRGHIVHAYMNEDCKNTKRMADLGVVIHTYRSDSSCFFGDETFLEIQSRLLLDGIHISHILTEVSKFRSNLLDEIKAFLGSDETIQKLGNINFDFCIIDSTKDSAFGSILPYRLDIPFAAFLADFNPAVAGVPGLPSFIPAIWSHFTNEMTFFERLANILILNALAIWPSQWPFPEKNLVSEYAPGKPFITMGDLQKKTKLWLVRSDVALDYPQVRMPHIIDIGGLNTRPPNPLPQDLQEIADKAKNGLIIVSFGTYFLTLPEATEKKLFEAFKQLKQTVIWKYNKTPKESLPSNIHLIKWIPQNDLLAHRNTKLFITHCGSNSQFEALYNSVPMLGFPIFADQMYNSLRMAKKGLGIHMDLLKFKPQELISAINRILTNDTYKNKMTLHSAIFKDQPMHPMETLIYWVEHVMKYGSEHLVSPAIHMPWYTYWCIDVVLFFIVLVGILICCSLFSLRSIYGCLCRTKKNKVKKE